MVTWVSPRSGWSRVLVLTADGASFLTLRRRMDWSATTNTPKSVCVGERAAGAEPVGRDDWTLVEAQVPNGRCFARRRLGAVVARDEDDVGVEPTPVPGWYKQCAAVIDDPRSSMVLAEHTKLLDAGRGEEHLAGHLVGRPRVGGLRSDAGAGEVETGVAVRVTARSRSGSAISSWAPPSSSPCPVGLGLGRALLVRLAHDPLRGRRCRGLLRRGDGGAPAEVGAHQGGGGDGGDGDESSPCRSEAVPESTITGVVMVPPASAGARCCRSRRSQEVVMVPRGEWAGVDSGDVSTARCSSDRLRRTRAGTAVTPGKSPIWMSSTAPDSGTGNLRIWSICGDSRVNLHPSG